MSSLNKVPQESRQSWSIILTKYQLKPKIYNSLALCTALSLYHVAANFCHLLTCSAVGLASASFCKQASINEQNSGEKLSFDGDGSSKICQTKKFQLVTKTWHIQNKMHRNAKCICNLDGEHKFLILWSLHKFIFPFSNFHICWGVKTTTISNPYKLMSMEILWKKVCLETIFKHFHLSFDQHNKN